MAIDTASRRLASLDFEEVWAEAIPIPDGTVGTADRWHSVWSYYQVTVVVAVDYYYVVTTPRGERIYPYNISEGVTATINPLNVWALPPEYNSTTLYIPTPGASLYLNQPGCGLTLDLLSPDYWILEDESGEWGFEDGTIMGVG